jgi:hypothetical protein
MLGVSKNPDEIPEHEVKSSAYTFKYSNDARGEKESPHRRLQPQKLYLPVYTCPRAPFYRETKGLLHSDNTLELKEYS